MKPYDFLDDEVDFDEPNLDPEDEDKPWALASCGCTDYHMADCPIRTG